MKKTIIFIFFLIGISFPSFGLTDPALVYYESDFRLSTPSDPLGGWTCWGSGKKAKNCMVGNSGNMLGTLFPEGGSPYISVDFADFGIVYCSNSTTEEGGAANEWLISPPIDLSDAPENLMLAFDVFSYGSENEPKFEVYVSTSGNRPEDFTSDAVYKGKSQNSPDYPICSRVYKSISGVSEPEVYIAFVNKSRDAQILGFKDISISEYELDLVNHTPSFYTTPEEVKVSFSLGMQTPVKCEGFTAVLSYLGEEQVQSTKKQMGSSYIESVIEFPIPIALDFGASVDYSITVTPNYEGATPAIFNYNMGCTKGYPSVCVEEEGTGTWCGWCVRGIAGMNQFSDDYGDRFIGIAIHSKDPMEVSSYLTPWVGYTGINAFPGCSFNRIVNGDPYDRSTVDNILSTNVGYAVAIKSVTYDEAGSNRLSLTYAPKLAWTTSSANISAAVVVVEDGVAGTTSEWNQMNNYAGYTQGDIEALYGKDAWPYFSRFCEQSIPMMLFTDMEYDHVAMGIFNDFRGGGEGGSLPSSWVADEEQEFTISFEMPLQSATNRFGVRDWKRTHVIVLIIDNVTGAILTAAKVGAQDYILSGVESTSLSATTEVRHQGDKVFVSACGNANVAIYNMYGLCVFTSDFEDLIEINASAYQGSMVVRVTRGNDAYVKKIMF